jgi:hypothetical protein
VCVLYGCCECGYAYGLAGRKRKLVKNFEDLGENLGRDLVWKLEWSVSQDFV